MKRAERTDCHRPSVVDPNDYSLMFHYSFATADLGEGDREYIDPEGMEDLEHARQRKDIHFADVHGAGTDQRCDVCGAHFVWGACFQHGPSGEFVVVGNNCADTICAGYNTTAYDRRCAKNKRLAALAAKRRRERRARNVKLRAFLKKYPGINKVLKNSHRISADMRAKVIQWGDISEKQVALAHRLVTQVKERLANEPDTVDIPEEAIDGRHTYRGTILGLSEQESYTGGMEWKMIVLIPHGPGAFKLFGSIPAALYDAISEMHEGAVREYVTAVRVMKGAHAQLKEDDPRKYSEVMGEKIEAIGGRPDRMPLKGSRIQFDCKVRRSKDDKAFGFINRPTKATFITFEELVS